jgi:Putative phospholipid-binding domain.
MEQEIRKNLLGDKITGLSIQIHDGVVTMTGHVPTAADRQKAYDDASKVSGVKSIVNNIDVQ